mgnify:CR=1 FL=1
MKRKIDAMHLRFGILPDKRCEDCTNLIKGKYHGLSLRKCTVYGATHSEATDWRKKYIACGMYNKGYTGTRPIIELLKCGKREFEEIPIHGQIDLLETMEEYE